MISASCETICACIRRDLPRQVKLLAVVKDEAYGHGALDVARIALEEGAWGFGLSTLEEAMALRDVDIKAPLFCSANGRKPNSNGVWRMT